MSELDLHIEKKIPFALYETQEGDNVVVFPAELRFIKGEISAVMKNEIDFNNELAKLRNTYSNFQSLRPTKP